MENVLSQQWLIIALIIIGIGIGAFLAKKDALQQGHFIIIILYILFVVILILNYSKLKDLRPKQYNTNIRKNILPKSVNIVGCSNLNCLEPIENTYEYNISINDNQICRSKYIDWTKNDAFRDVKSCYKNLRDEVEVTNQGVNKRRIFNLKLRDFFIKSAFNCCASGNLKNDYVNIESMNLAIKLGCRFLDFEIYTINGEPAVAVSTNRDSFHYKESFNHLPFDEVMKNAKERATTTKGCKNYSDPLILHLRIKTSRATTFKKIATILRNTFGSTIITVNEISQTVTDMSPFSIPIQSTIGRVFVIFHNYAGLETIVSRSNQYMSEYIMTNTNDTDMKYVLTTWSGDRDNTRDQNQMLREHLYIVYGIERERFHHQTIAKISDSDTGKLNENWGFGKMSMLWPFKTNDAILEPSYKTINNDLAERENSLIPEQPRLNYFAVGDNLREHAKIAKGKLIQIVPICVQEYQNIKINEKNDGLNNNFFYDWWKFFHSARYTKYNNNIPNLEDRCPVGLRQRIPKYDDIIVTSSIAIPNNHHRPVQYLNDYLTSN